MPCAMAGNCSILKQDQDPEMTSCRCVAGTRDWWVKQQSTRGPIALVSCPGQNVTHMWHTISTLVDFQAGTVGVSSPGA